MKHSFAFSSRFQKTKLSFGIFISSFLTAFMLMEQAKAEQPKQSITPEMIESYLDQILQLHSKGLVRFERGFLETGVNRSHPRYEHLRNQTEYLKAGLSVALVPDDLKEKLFEHFKQNLDDYKKYTGLNIRYIPQGANEKNVFFDMAIAGMPVYKMTSHPAYKNYLYPGLSGKKLTAAIEKQKKLNSVNKITHMIRHKNRSINATFGFLDTTHPIIEKTGVNTVWRHMDQMFFEMFTHAHTVENLPSIMLVPNYSYDRLQPLDIAFVKALYSDQVHAGMDINKAKPLLKQHMLSTLNQQ